MVGMTFNWEQNHVNNNIGAKRLVYRHVTNLYMYLTHKVNITGV